ncbi:MAG: DUF4390 domain-containing protein [Desulfobacter sp.]|jgi:hypothetical protein|uniref:DUF4390 domain-containing protein n=1 Tax=uncultured Desulfobacter sp. TaxID=240139 RepID=UPI0029C62833|nr:DUF4390 domain-containing protein [uncultured Desulfobacter sp.]MCW8799930.1 DUF4390 domain-containing protein [Desulfobacter sp.]
MKIKHAFTRFLCVVVFFITGLLFIVPGIAIARDNAVLSDIKLANTRDDLFAYFKVEKAFNEKNIQAITNGISTSFTFYVTLFKTSSSLFDKKIIDIETRATIKYNSMKQEYTVICQWKDAPPLITKSFDEAKTWMTEIDNLKVVPLDRLIKGGKYQIRIKAELEKVTLPLSLHYVFFFVSYWDFETDWYVINFTY